MFEDINNEKNKFGEYKEFDFENGIKLVFRVLGNEPSLRFIDQDGKDIIDLAEFAPAGIILEFGEKWRAGEIEGGGAAITVGEFSNPADAVLSFLHEAGHLDRLDTSRAAHWAREKYSEAVKTNKFDDYAHPRLKAMDEARKAEMISERNAWAFAIKKSREIEKRLHIKIFDKLGGQASVAQKAKKFADEFLGSYEKRYLDELYDLQIYTEQEMDEFFKSLDKVA